MIKEQASKAGGAQFITTTFRPELVQAATQCYGINFKNKVSTIRAISMKKALAIIKASETELGEGGGGEASTSTSVSKSPSRVEEEEEEEEEEEASPMEEGGEEEEEEEDN